MGVSRPAREAIIHKLCEFENLQAHGKTVVQAVIKQPNLAKLLWPWQGAGRKICP